MKLRPYQELAVASVLEALDSHQSTLVQLPTGCGKTIVFATLVREWERRGLGRAMVLAHTRELIDQAADKIGAVTGRRPEVEMASQWADMGGMWSRAHCVVSSVQTQIRGRMRRFRPQDFGLVVVDEAHRTTAASYRRILEHYQANRRCKVLHVTATPDRMDGVSLGSVVESVAYQYDIRNAVDDGWLVPIRQTIVRTGEIDYTGIRQSKGDFTAADLERVMTAERALHAVCTPTIEIAGRRRTLIFAAGVRHAEMMAEILNRHRPGCAAYVHGGMHRDERKRILTDYQCGRIQFLCNAQVLIEGFDDPGVSCVVVARSTMSRARYAQMIGRGTRPLPGVVDGPETPEERHAAIAFSLKPDLLVLDFAGNAGKHRLVTAADVLGGNAPPEVIGRAAKMAEDGEGDVRAMLDEAAAEVERERQEAEREARRLAEEARKRALTASVQFETEDLNPFSVALQRAIMASAVAERPLSDAMRVQLEKRGVDCSGLGFSDGRRMMAELRANQWRTPQAWRKRGLIA